MRWRVKGWKREELSKLKELVNQKDNIELCEIFNVDMHTLKNALTRNNIKRDPAFVQELIRSAQQGEKHHNWKGGISKDAYHYNKIAREKFPEKVRVRDHVRYAIKIGKLVRQSCQYPGCTFDDLEKIEAHHESYEEEHILDVMWLCPKHHRIKDKERRKREGISGSEFSNSSSTKI